MASGMWGARLRGLMFGVALLGSGAMPAAAQKDTNTVVWGMAGIPRHLNQAVQSGVYTMEPGAQIFASPIRFDENYKPQPYLAESWRFEDDGRSLVLKLVKGATFHDGKPVTSADFAFSIMAVKAHHPFQAMMSAVERVDTPDAETAIIRMSQPHPAILDALSPPFCPILPKHVFDDGTDLKVHPRNNNPVGSGPFRFVEFKPGEHIILERNKDFFLKDRPKLDRIVIRLFKDPAALALAMEAKEVHFSTFIADIPVIDQLAKVPGLVASPLGGEAIGPIAWLAFNLTKKPFDDVRVRQALSFAIDREFITKRLHRGRSQIATGPITLGTPFYTDDVERYKVDLAKAEQLLDAAGLRKDASGIRFRTSIDFGSSRDYGQNIAEYFRSQFRRIGVDLELRQTPDFPTWARRVGGHEFDMTMDLVFNWGDPVVGVHRTYLTSNIRKGVVWSNTQSYSNPRVDELLALASVEPDVAKRKAFYKEFQQIVVREAPIAFLTVISYHQIFDARLDGLPRSIWGSTSPVDELRWK
jgi:peptide/nickel transport system substrate-binding protein